jgi:UDP-N-acetylmuramate--alanine ligase
MTKDTFNLPIICVFQPHTYTRTRTLFNKFLNCFKGAEEVHIIDTYSARENYDYLGSAARLVCELKEKGENVFGIYARENFLKQLKKMPINDSVILFLGAGNIEDVAKKLV